MSVLFQRTSLIFGVALALSAFNVGGADAQGVIITVGVRRDAAPFSYLKNDADPLQLASYGGYVVQICRKVLDDLRSSSGSFRRASVVARPVDSLSRFKALQTGEIDLLCDPTTVTEGRVLQFNVTFPIFLTGVGLASIGYDRYPSGHYCSGLVGYVDGTTAATGGLKTLAVRGQFGKFSADILHLYEQAKKDETGAIERDRAADLRNEPTPRCPNGFSNVPISIYTEHAQAVDDFCEGRILFYVGDIDIIASALRQETGCSADVDRNVVSRDLYGIFFRSNRTAGRNGRGLPPNLEDALYADFNMQLLLNIQSESSLLEQAFAENFFDLGKTRDLAAFFRTVSFISAP